MRRAIGVLTLAALGVLPATARAASLDIRAGGFFPRANSNLFDDSVELYTVSKRDFRGFTGGVELDAALTPNLELGFHVDGYSRSVDTSYRDFVHDDGREIQQTLKLRSIPVGVSLRLSPAGRGSVSPYLAVGADLVVWRYEMFGDFVDFRAEDLPVISDAFESDGVAPGFHVAGGVRVKLSHDFSLVGEARYLAVPSDEMNKDFAQTRDRNKIDLSGVSALVGLSIRF